MEAEIGMLAELGPVPFAESSAPDGEGFGEEGVLEETNEVDGPEATRRNDLGGQVDGLGRVKGFWALHKTWCFSRTDSGA